ncbi:hypothetical protein [Caulobacter sp. LARHSG274]
MLVFAMAAFASFVARPAAALTPTSCHDRYLAGRAIPKQVEEWVCADPALAALERAAFKTFADQRIADEGASLESEDNLRSALINCQDAQCVRRRYQDRLDEVVQGAPFPLSHGRSMHRVGHPPRATIWSRDLGGGWRVFKFDIDNGPLPESLPDSGVVPGYYEGQEMFVAEMVHGKTRYRGSEGSAFDIEIQKDGSWKVTQIGECQCGGGLSYTGIYR